MPTRILDIPPRFRVVTAAGAANGTAEGAEPPDDRTIVLGGGAAFGDGTHESTRMCVQALAAFAPRQAFRLFDVGSGTGILSIAAAKLGGEALGVDIDARAVVIAEENARRSGVAARATFSTTWPEPARRFDVVVSNIGRDVLLALAARLAERLEEAGTLILSGLVSTDVPSVIACYAPLLAGSRVSARPSIFERDAWRALVWRKATAAVP